MDIIRVGEEVEQNVSPAFKTEYCYVGKWERYFEARRSQSDDYIDRGETRQR